MGHDPKPEINTEKVAEVKSILTVYDKDGDGKLNAKELSEMKREYDAHTSPVQALLEKSYDKNHDGKLDDLELEEIKRDIQSTDLMVRYAGYGAILPRMVRYLAYTSDLGEAFRPIAHPYFVTGSYAISWAYVAGDVTYEGYKEYSTHGVRGMDLAQGMTKRATFQAIASMALPAFTIHSTVKVGKKIFAGGRFQKWGPTMLGLAVVPVLPYLWDHPVEHATDYVFDTVWPVKGKGKAIKDKAH